MLKKLAFTCLLLLCMQFVFSQTEYYSGKLIGTIFGTDVKLIKVQDSIVVTNDSVLNVIFAQFGVFKCEKTFLQGWGDTLDNAYMIECNCDETILGDRLIELPHAPIKIVARIPIPQPFALPSDYSLQGQPWHLDNIEAEGAWSLYTRQSKS